MTTAAPPDLDQQIARLRQAALTASQRQARAEHDRDVAAGQVEAIKAELRDSFGVGSADEAQALLAQLDAQLTAEAAKVQEQLAQAGVPGA